MRDKEDISVAILAGGLGTRLAPLVNDRPKVLALVNNHSFLEYLLNQLDRSNFRKVILCTGYLGSQVEKTFGKHYKRLRLFYSHEPTSLGTAGSLRLALPLLKSKTVLVMNGDSFCDVNLGDIVRFHMQKKASATIVISRVSDISHYGKVNIARNNVIIGFQEKKSKGTGYVNAGIYVIDKSLIEKIPLGKEISIEKDIFPAWLGRGFYGYKTLKDFIDIGTPERYEYAQKVFQRFVILDRDGTVIEYKHHLSAVDDVRLIPGAAGAIKHLNQQGLGVVIITNQSVVGRGLVSLSGLNAIHKKILHLLAVEGAHIDAIYYCPHKPEDNCTCRKPKFGLVEKAIEDHHFDPKLSFVVGDNTSDIELGKNLGATTILVKTGHGEKVVGENLITPNFIVNNLYSAVSVIEKEIQK